MVGILQSIDKLPSGQEVVSSYVNLNDAQRSACCIETFTCTIAGAVPHTATQEWGEASCRSGTKLDDNYGRFDI